MPEKIMGKSATNFAHSEALEEHRLGRAHIASWRDNGFALVHDLLPDTLLQSLKEDALGFYPAPGTEAATHTLIILAAVRNLCFLRNQRRVMR